MDFERFFIKSDLTIKETLGKMDETAHKFLIIVDEEKAVSGVVTDGDIRRWILKNGDLEEKVFKIANKNPILLTIEDDEYKIKKIMIEKQIEAIPVVDKDRKVISICFWYDFFEDKFKKNQKMDLPVVIMAGGKGTRLYPYTKILPKPLIPIGEKPIMEHIIDRFREYGCHEFYASVNYKANMIKAYFNEFDQEFKVNYVQEEMPLGTGGSLYLLKDIIKTTFFVSNCDILVEADYYDMYKYHKEKNNKITMIASLKHYVIPYGVVEINHAERVKHIKEKPSFDFLVNTGMYILEPDVIHDIPENKFFHITDLINLYLENGKNVGVYPISEKSWLDMGQIEEMQQMIERMGVKK